MDTGLLVAVVVLIVVLIIYYLRSRNTSEAEYQIDMDEALDLMVNFLNQSDINPITNSIPIGGTLTIDALSNRIDDPAAEREGIYQGRRGWFCYMSGGADSLALAWEGVAIRKDQINDVGTINKNELYLPDANHGLISFRRTNTGAVTREEVLDFLATTTNFQRPAGNLVLPVSQIRRMTDSYGTNSLRYTDGTEMNESNAIFFNEGSDHSLQMFRRNMGKPITHFRYFFGFSDVHYGRQCIRVILMGVDEYGNNLIGSEACVLQKSWPPSP
jgi:hypothetical protein